VINHIKGKTVIVIEFRSDTPHLETSLEIAARLSKNNNVSYFHAGKELCDYPLYNRKKNAKLLGSPCPISLSQQLTRAKFPQIEFIDPREIYCLVNKDVMPGLCTSFVNISDLMMWKYDGQNLGIGVFSTLVDLSKSSSPKISRYKRQIDLLVKSAILSYSLCLELLESKKPDAIVIFNGRFAAEHAAKVAARKSLVEVYFHERAGTKDRYFFANYMTHQFENRMDEINLISSRYSNSDLAEFGKKYFQSNQNGESVSWHSFIGHQLTHRESLKRLAPNINPNLKLATYYSSSDDEYASLDCRIKPFLSWGSQVEAVACLQAILASHGYQLCLRVHPNLMHKSSDEQSAWERVGYLVRQSGGIYISCADPINSYSIFDVTSIVVTGGSTIGVEALAAGLPVIVITECVYQDLSPSIYKAFDPIQFKNRVASHAKQSSVVHSGDANKYACWVYCHGHEFESFQPATLVSGYFLGRDVNELSMLARSLKIIIGPIRRLNCENIFSKMLLFAKPAFKKLILVIMACYPASNR
jgi:hypothetical protein